MGRSQSVTHVIWFRSQFIVFLMSADPNPEECITLDKAAHRAITFAYAR